MGKLLMKKSLLILILCSVLANHLQAAPKATPFVSGIQLYKAGDYANAKNALSADINKDPSNAFAHYYLAMCFVKLNDLNSAKNEYKQAIKLNESSAIANYAIEGLNNLGDKAFISKETVIPNKEKSAYATSPYGSIDNPICTENKEPKIEKAKKLNEVSVNKTTKNEKPTQEVSLNNENNENKVTASPSPEELKKAYEIISKSGMPNNMNINPEMMQLQMMMSSMGGFGNNNMMGNSMNSMMMGGNNSNPMAMMMPMIMSQMANKNGKSSEDSGMNAQLIQSMMTNMMMPNMFGSDNNNNDGGSNY